MKVNFSDGERDIRSVWFENGMVRMIDQRVLPSFTRVVDLLDHCQVADSIVNMTVRGAPSIGVAAAFGMVLAARNGEDLEEAADLLRGTRPTANDLFYAVDHMVNSIASGNDPLQTAQRYSDSIVKRCRLIGRHGAPLIQDGTRVITHCNAGALATVDIGTALAPIRTAWSQGRKMFVYVSETRPRMQGMRLTAWELMNEGIPHAIIPDGASGHFMRQGMDLVLTGADRIAPNGDFANKIGTYEKAVLAREIEIPFYVAAPVSTFDFSISTGEDIPIEHRGEEEVTVMEGTRVAPLGSTAFNPAFDVTPSRLVSGYITELGILEVGDIQRMKGETDDL